MAIVWSDGWSVNNQILDAQHRQLVGFFNQAEEVVTAATPNLPISFHEILNNIAEHAKKHFDSEEKILSEHGFKDLSEHAAKHEELYSSLVDYLLDSTTGNMNRIAFVKYLHKWIMDHILVQDSQYKDLLKH